MEEALDLETLLRVKMSALPPDKFEGARPHARPHTRPHARSP